MCETNKSPLEVLSLRNSKTRLLLFLKFSDPFSCSSLGYTDTRSGLTPELFTHDPSTLCKGGVRGFPFITFVYKNFRERNDSKKNLK